MSQLDELIQEMQNAKITPKFDPMAVKAKLEKKMTQIIKRINHMDRVEPI